MKTSRKLAVAAILALLVLPTFQTTAAYADNRRGNDCEDQDDDDCREKPRLQTKFFSE